MNDKCCAVLIDTVSIQRYIFGSNRLKENLGASYLVDNIFKSYLQETAEFLFKKIDMDFWEKDYDARRLPKHKIEIGYIGGGNALLLFNEPGDAQAFIKEWTRRLLIYAPGLNTAAAIATDFSLNGEFTGSKKELFRELGKNKSRYTPQTSIPRHGITAECRSSGLSMDIWQESPEGEYVSALTRAKLQAGNCANEFLEKEFEDILKEYGQIHNESFCFTDQLDLLGQTKGEENQIAIVHIDGNEIGKKFKDTKTLAQIRTLSVSVKEATRNAFRELLRTILQKQNLKEIKEEFKLNLENGKTILPIRPIIIGGDDITFVCPGKLGIYFAKVFLEKFADQEIDDGLQIKKYDACAGVAITKTKYPFYRGYNLAEKLCNSAKKARSESTQKSGSWIDFHIAYGGFSGTLEEIRETRYRAPQGRLWMRPYQLTSSDKYKAFETLLFNACHLRWKRGGEDETNFSNNKRNEFRKVLTLGENATRAFMLEMREKGADFDAFEVESTFKEKLFKFPGDLDKGVTAYFDMIEISEFYPEFELRKQCKGVANGDKLPD